MKEGLIRRCARGSLPELSGGQREAGHLYLGAESDNSSVFRDNISAGDKDGPVVDEGGREDRGQEVPLGARCPVATA